MNPLIEYFRFAFIFASILSLGIGLLLLLKNRKSVRNRIFGLLSFMTVIWAIGFYGLISTEVLDTARQWRWFMESGSIFIPALWTH